MRCAAESPGTVGANPHGALRSDAATIHADAANKKVTKVSDHWVCVGDAHSGTGFARKLGSQTRTPKRLIIMASNVAARRGRTPKRMPKPAAA